jgi:UDP-glucose 4-epimerase
MNILITGGSGYIGSFTVKALQGEADNKVVVFDDLAKGHREAIPETKIYQGNLLTDEIILDQAFKENNIDAVIHFAAHIEAGESVENPQKHIINNVCGSVNLFKVMLENKVNKLVFSSSAAVYGNPKNIPVSETEEKNPTNPYGETKSIVEKIIYWYSQAYNFNAVALRYFNAAGAALDGSMGQDYPKPTHLITRACEAALGKRDDFQIFGGDYDTKDGTAVRDYIHVLDLASAHIAALEYLKDKKGFEIFNIGSGVGYSVKEVVDMVKKVSSVDFSAPVVERRAGDPSELIADASKAKKTLGWEAKHSDLETIIQSAWLWQKNNPEGYSKD